MAHQQVLHHRLAGTQLVSVLDPDEAQRGGGAVEITHAEGRTRCHAESQANGCDLLRQAFPAILGSGLGM
eukprot:327-Eustigmatos_ZCMA.PRE.1